MISNLLLWCLIVQCLIDNNTRQKKLVDRTHEQIKFTKVKFAMENLHTGEEQIKFVTENSP